MNKADNAEFMQPRTYEERQEVASACTLGLKLTIPALVDGMDNAADRAYNGWPERLYILSVEGKIAYQGGKGPYGFNPQEMEMALRDLLTPAQ